MKRDCRENCAHFKLHTEGERVTVCNHPNGPSIVYPRVEPWACSLWRQRSKKLSSWNSEDKVFCMSFGKEKTIFYCQSCSDNKGCPIYEFYAKNHAPGKK